MEKIQNLLNQVSIIIKKNDELLDATSGRFNVFSLCKVDHYEPIHSKIIAEFLNPKGSHGFGNQFLDAFMKIIREGNGEIKDFILKDNTKVRTEHGEGVDGFIDILISDGENAVIIENKIYAVDQCKQLIRYNQFAKEKYKKSIILYLTLDGSDASEQSSKGVEYTIISYKVTIRKWLERCIQIAALRPIVRETLLQYKNHINKLTGEDMESQYKDELINICSKKENIEGAFCISENINGLKEKIINDYLIPELNDYAIKKNLKFTSNNDILIFKKEEWSNTELKFTSDGNNRYTDRYYGLKKLKADFPMYEDQNIVNALEKIGKENRWWFANKYNSLYRNWNKEAFIDIVNGNMAKEIERVIDEVLGIVYGLDL